MERLNTFFAQKNRYGESELSLLAKQGHAKAAAAMLLLLVLAIPAQRVLAQSPAALNETCPVSLLQPKLRAATAFETQSVAEQVTASTLASSR